MTTTARRTTQRVARSTKSSSSRSASRPGARSPKRRLWVWLRRAGITIVASILLAIVGLALVLWFYGRDLPTVDSLRHYEPPQTTRVVDRNGRVLGEIFTERRTVVPMARIPKVFVYSVLAAEDADFYEHEGLDYPGLLRALGRALLSGDQPRGTSTITQQVVKLMLLSPEQTLSRKIKELLLARRLEQELTKEEILHLYVNHINFGHGRYGVQEAARFYFGKDVEDLTLAEASLLAGIPQSPTRLSPRSHPDAARRRQRFVLDQLADKREAHWPEITPAQIEEARSAEIALVSSSETRERAPEIVAMARAVLEGRVSETAFARGGFTIHTTIDIEAQDAARQALRTGLEALDQRRENLGPLEAPRRNARIRAVSELELGATYDARVTGANESELELDVGGHTARASIPARFNPRELSPSAFAEEGARVRISVRELPEGGPALVDLELGAQAAIVVIEPRSREILAMVGGYDSAYGFNRAVQARRQPGSTFKPIVYALAIKNRRLTPASMLLDAPTVYADGYRPSDFQTHRYRGLVRVREALADSLNACAINAIDAVGVDETIVFARSLGIESPLEPVPSLALGTSEVSVLELTNAYATFAAGGRFEEARWLDHIEGPDGARIAGDRDRTARDVLSAAEAHVVTSLLRSVVETGTAHEARSLNRPAAGKTGTSDDARDAWFVGYTPDLVAGVWVGFDDRRPLGRRESGAKAALPIWIGAMRRLSANRRSVDFPTPSGTVVARIDPASGLLAYEGMQEPLEEVFLEGTAPTEVARSPDIADPDSFLMDQIGDPTLPAGERAPGTTP